MNEEKYHALFHEIIQGKTRFWYNSKPLFFLHPTPQIKSEALLMFEDWKTEAERRGILSNDQARLKAISNGEWSENMDQAVKNLQTEISFMRKAESNLQLPSQKVKQKRLIKEEEKKLSNMLSERKAAFGKTSEDYALLRSSQELIRISIIDDSDGLVWPDRDEFDEVETGDFNLISNEYQKIESKINDDVIQNLVLQDFFYIYMPHCEKPFHLFGKPVIQLTAYQAKTSTYGNIFYHILQRHENLSESARKNPEQLLAIASSKDKRDKHQPHRKGASAVFGATDEDINAITSDGSSKRASLKDKISELSSGGSALSGPAVADLFG